MALFQGEDIVPVTGADGRTLMLPRSLVPASMTTQQVGQGPGPIGPTAYTPDMPAPTDTPSVTSGMSAPDDATFTGGQALPAPDAGPPPDAAAPPDFTLGTVDNTDKAVAAGNKAYDARQKAAATYAASPEGKVAAVEAERQRAVAEQKDAGMQAANVEAAGQDVMADSYRARNQSLDAMAADQQKEYAAVQKERDAKAAEFGALKKKIANTKIDRSSDHPVIAAIGLVLAAIGSAYKKQGDKNPAIDAFYKSIDQKVAGQMADLENKKAALGFTKDELSLLKEKASDKLALNKLLLSAETEKYARQFEETAMRTKSDQTKANALSWAAQLRERSAAQQMEATKYQLDYDQKAQAEKNQNSRFYSGLNQQAQFHAEDMKLAYDKMANDDLRALAAERAKAGLEGEKQLQAIKDKNVERGLNNLVSREPILTEEGVQRMKEADGLEAEAAKVREQAKTLDPEAAKKAEIRAQGLADKASQTRGDARIRNVLQLGSPEQQGKFREQYNGAQTVTSLIDDLKGLYYGPNGGKKLFETDANRAAVQAKATELMMALKTAWQLGVLSKQDMGAISQGTGGIDPQKWDAGTMLHALNLKIGQDPEAFIARLDALGSDTRKTFANALGGVANAPKNLDPDKLFAVKTPALSTPEGKATATMNQERQAPADRAAEIENRGAVSKAAHGIGRALFTPGGAYGNVQSNEDVTSEAYNSGSILHVGMTNKQAGAYDDLLKSYQKGNKASGDQLVQQVLQGSPGTAVATLNALRDTAPDLYKSARAGITDPKVLEKVQYAEKNQVAVHDMLTPMLVEAVRANPADDVARAELAKRAVARDPLAVKATHDIIFSRIK